MRTRWPLAPGGSHVYSRLLRPWKAGLIKHARTQCDFPCRLTLEWCIRLHTILEMQVLSLPLRRKGSTGGGQEHQGPRSPRSVNPQLKPHAWTATDSSMDKGRDSPRNTFRRKKPLSESFVSNSRMSNYRLNLIGLEHHNET